MLICAEQGLRIQPDAWAREPSITRPPRTHTGLLRYATRVPGRRRRVTDRHACYLLAMLSQCLYEPTACALLRAKAYSWRISLAEFPFQSQEDPMASTTYVSDGANRRGADSLSHKSLPFISTCPKCNSEQSQRGFSRAALGRLLAGGHPIESYCEGCDDFWSISTPERHALAGRLAE